MNVTCNWTVTWTAMCYYVRWGFWHILICKRKITACREHEQPAINYKKEPLIAGKNKANFALISECGESVTVQKHTFTTGWFKTFPARQRTCREAGLDVWHERFEIWIDPDPPLMAIFKGVNSLSAMQTQHRQICLKYCNERITIEKVHL